MRICLFQEKGFLALQPFFYITGMSKFIYIDINDINGPFKQGSFHFLTSIHRF